MGYETNNPNGDSGIRTHEYGNQNPVPFTSWRYPFDSGLAGSAPFLIHWYAQRQFRDLDGIVRIQESFRSFYIHRLFLFRKFSFFTIPRINFIKILVKCRNRNTNFFCKIFFRNKSGFISFKAVNYLLF